MFKKKRQGSKIMSRIMSVELLQCFTFLPFYNKIFIHVIVTDTSMV